MVAASCSTRWNTGPFVVRVRSSAAWQVATGNACTGAGRDDWLTVDVVTPGRIVLTQRVDWLTLLEDDADRSCHEDRQVAIPTSGHFLRARQPGDRLAAVVDTGPLLRIDGLTKRYPGATALDDLTVEVPRGRIGLVGANGAGKTTTFRLLLGLAHPTEGRIEVCGIDVARRSDRRARRGSATCPSTTACRSTRPRPTSCRRSAS